MPSYDHDLSADEDYEANHPVEVVGDLSAEDEHPALNRELDWDDLMKLPRGSQVVDRYGVLWSKTAGIGVETGRWIGEIEQEPGLVSYLLVTLCGPIRRARPEQLQPHEDDTL